MFLFEEIELTIPNSQDFTQTKDAAFRRSIHFHSHVVVERRFTKDSVLRDSDTSTWTDGMGVFNIPWIQTSLSNHLYGDVFFKKVVM